MPLGIAFLLGMGLLAGILRVSQKVADDRQKQELCERYQMPCSPDNCGKVPK